MNTPGLPSLNEIEVQEFGDIINVKATLASPPDGCPICGVIRQHNLKRYGKKQQVFVDIPHRGKRVGIFVQRQRRRCMSCTYTFWEALPDMDDRRWVTKRLLEYIQKQTLRLRFETIADEVGVDEKTIRNILGDYAAKLNADYKPYLPEWLGIDEVYIEKVGRAVLTDIDKHGLVDMLPNRLSPTIEQWLKQFDLSKVKYVTMDMCGPYRRLVRKMMPQALIIIDKFHIQRYANHALDKVRKKIGATLSHDEEKRLKRQRKVMMDRHSDLGPAAIGILEFWLRAFPELADAYELKEMFYDIFDSKTREDAIEQFNTWQTLFTPEVEKYFKPVAKTVKTWHKEIFNYFEKRITNAYTESKNGLIKAINHEGRGYSFEVLRAKALFGKKIKRPKYTRQWMVSSRSHKVTLDEATGYIHSIQFDVDAPLDLTQQPGRVRRKSD